ncbi:MAG: DUF4142 domain-containing protein [Sphingobacteriaceae bacterium]|nr:DUF4142 domain-containing protein [Cytophagaceae bacterium]
MNPAQICAFTLAGLLTFSACTDNRSKTVTSEQDNRAMEGTAPTDSTGLTDNLNDSAKTDSAVTAGNVSTNPATGSYSDGAGATKTASRTSTTGEAAAFLRDAAISNLTEIESSQLALKASSNAEIRRFAGMMVADHQKNNGELKTLAATNNVVLPTSLTPDKMEEIAELRTSVGPAFDRAYVALQVKAHQQTVAKFESAAQAIGDTDVKNYATKSLPVLRQHLKLITDLEAKTTR